MELKIFGTTWGSELSLTDTLFRIKEAGYDGVEMLLPESAEEQHQLRRELQKLDLRLIAMQIPFSSTVQGQLSEIEGTFDSIRALEPLFVNCHSGKDYFDFEDNCRIIDFCQELSTKHDLPFFHETHRGRFAYSAKATAEYLQKLPDLELTADFSHWCCVSESLLEDQNDFVKAAIGRTQHIHARVGHAEGPQVSDPQAPEWAVEVDRHWEWWDQVADTLRSQQKNVLTVTPEFGPPNYLPTLPFTKMPVANQWELNNYMKECFLSRYHQ